MQVLSIKKFKTTKRKRNTSFTKRKFLKAVSKLLYYKQGLNEDKVGNQANFGKLFANKVEWNRK